LAHHGFAAMGTYFGINYLTVCYHINLVKQAGGNRIIISMQDNRFVSQYLHQLGWKAGGGVPCRYHGYFLHNRLCVKMLKKSKKKSGFFQKTFPHTHQ
jgi:hypothetical protein